MSSADMLEACVLATFPKCPLSILQVHLGDIHTLHTRTHTYIIIYIYIYIYYNYDLHTHIYIDAHTHIYNIDIYTYKCHMGLIREQFTRDKRMKEHLRLHSEASHSCDTIFFVLGH